MTRHKFSGYIRFIQLRFIESPSIHTFCARFIRSPNNLPITPSFQFLILVIASCSLLYTTRILQRSPTTRQHRSLGISGPFRFQWRFFLTLYSLAVTVWLCWAALTVRRTHSLLAVLLPGFWHASRTSTWLLHSVIPHFSSRSPVATLRVPLCSSWFSGLSSHSISIPNYAHRFLNCQND